MGGKSSKPSQPQTNNHAIKQENYNNLPLNQQCKIKPPKCRRFQYNTNGQIINKMKPHQRVTITHEGTRKNGTTFKLHRHEPGFMSEKLNESMQMDISDAMTKLEILKVQYENSKDAIMFIDNVLTELKKINDLKVSEEEKKRQVYRLVKIEIELERKKRKEEMLESAQKGVDFVASLPLLAIESTIQIVSALGHVAAAILLTGSGARSKSKRRLTKKR